MALAQNMLKQFKQSHKHDGKTGTKFFLFNHNSDLFKIYIVKLQPNEIGQILFFESNNCAFLKSKV